MKKRNVYYIYLFLFTGFIVWQNTAKIYAQSVEFVDSKTGKPIDRENVPQFMSVGHFDGFIKNTKIRFFTDVILTKDEKDNLSKTVYLSENRQEIKKYFEKYIPVSQKIIERGKIKKDNQKTFERIVTVSENESGNKYNILLFDGGKSFISIVANKFDLALEFEKRLAFKK